MDKQEIKEIKKEIDIFSSIEQISNSKGGKIIIDGIKTDILNSINELSRYKDMSHTELIAVCAKLSERIDLYNIFKNSPKNKEIAREALDELLKEE